jgi:hypothetical protein
LAIIYISARFLHRFGLAPPSKIDLGLCSLGQDLVTLGQNRHDGILITLSDRIDTPHELALDPCLHLRHLPIMMELADHAQPRIFLCRV